MGKMVVVNHSYDLSDYFSSVSFDKSYTKLNNYLIRNEHLIDSLFYDRKNKKFKVKSTDRNNLLSIIKEVDYLKNLNKNLIRNIELKVSFNKETKQLELVEDEALNEINYLISYTKNIRNNLYFDSSALLINYENIYGSMLSESIYNLAILYFDKIIKYKNSNEITEFICFTSLSYNNELYEITGENITNEFIDENFDLSKFIEKYNNNEEIINSDYDVNVEDDIISEISYANFKLLKTNIKLLDNSFRSLLLFKNSMTNNMFEDFINENYNVAEDIITGE